MDNSIGPPGGPPSGPPVVNYSYQPAEPRTKHRKQLGKSDGLLAIWSVLCFVVGIMGGGAGFIIMFFVWVGPAFCLTLIYLLARSGRRSCPACGNRVKVGLTDCATCGFDFAAAARR